MGTCLFPNRVQKLASLATTLLRTANDTESYSFVAIKFWLCKKKKKSGSYEKKWKQFMKDDKVYILKEIHSRKSTDHV
jgi:hypothetical protein